MELFCLAITLLIFTAYYYFLSLLRPESILYKFLAAAVLTCAQIILTELFLGFVHQLYLSVVIIVNLSLGGLVLALGRRIARRHGAGFLLHDDFGQVRQAARTAFDGYAIALGLLAVLTYGWVLAAAYFLPPRGIDDLSYHLPTIFEYARSHEISLLPLATPQFAFPENAELLFLWPVLFTHDQRMVDGVNVPFVLLTVVAVYALARHFSLPKRDALFGALLFAFCPVVLMQAGVNYIDIIVALFLVLSLYFTLRYYEHQRWLDICMAGLSIGLLCGMKYTAPFLALPLQLLIIAVLRKGKWRHALGYGAIILLAGGWWYMRNAFVLGEALYPMHFQARVPDGLVNPKGGSIFQNMAYNLPYWIARYPLQDSQVGTYDGGFGLVFWGMCFSSWCFVTFRSIIAFRTGIPKLIVLSYVPAGFLILLAMPPRFVEYNGRLALFVVAIGLFAFSEVLAVMNDRVYKAVIKAVSIAMSVITVSLLFESVQPLYRFGEAYSDANRGARTSEFKYLSASFYPHVGLRPAWELLDLLTRDDQTGLNCSIASDPALYWSAPVFGSRLQNRVLNMGGKEGLPVDAYVCTFRNKSQLGLPVIATPGLGSATTIQEIMAKEDYVRVVQSDSSCLLIRRDIFNRPGKQRVLQAYYTDNWPDAIELAERLDPWLDPNIPLLASGEMGYGIRYIDMKKGRPDRVELVFDGREQEVVLQKRIVKCYTLQRPLSGYRAKKITQLMYKGKELEVFLNRRF